MFDRTQLKLADREMKFSKHSANFIEDLPQSQNIPNIFIQAAKEVIAGPTILFGGAHTLIRSGHQQYLIDMIEKGYINHVAMNGAAAFHDWEIAIFGNCCEPVETYLPDGRFGMWKEKQPLDALSTSYHRNSSYSALRQALTTRLRAAVPDAATPRGLREPPALRRSRR